MNVPSNHLLRWLAAAAALALAACGGGGNPPPPPVTSVTQTISAASGGTINGPGGVTLTIPPAALAADTAITIAIDDTGAPALPPALTPLASPLIALLPHGTTFGVPVTLSLPATVGQQELLATTNEQGDGWESLVSTQVGGRVEIALTHFSQIARCYCGIQNPPEIIGEPRDSPLLGEGGGINNAWIFRVDAVGRGPLTYAWMKNGGVLAFETNQDIMVRPLRFADNGARYSVRVTDADGRSVTSRAALLTVNAAPPAIVNQPTDVQVTVGANAVFTAASTSSTPQTLQWKRCDAGAACPADPSSWLDANATSTQLTLPAVALSASGARVAMCATNAGGTTCTGSATLTVLPAPVQPVVVTPPQPLTVTAGTSASFTVVATGGSLSYEWRSGRDGINFAPEGRCTDSATCTFSNVALGDDGLLLRVRVFNGAGQAFADPALLTVRLAAGVALARVAGTNTSSVGLRADGRLILWGQAGGTGTGNPFVEFGIPSDVATLASGALHSLAIRSNGDLLAWGSNTNGQLGDGTTDGRANPNLQGAGLAAARSVAAGMGVTRGQDEDNTRYSLAVTAANGLVWAWGANLSGQLGDGTIIERHQPVPVGRISGVSGTAAGDGHVLARRSDGSVWVWGRNTAGQLGTGNTSASLRPIPIPLADIVAVAAGEEFSVALRSDGTVFTWGSGLTGRLGNGSAQSRSTPAPITLPAPAIGIAAGAQHALVLLLDGRVYAWGRNDLGQTGTGNIASTVNTPQRVVAPLPANVIAIGSGSNHSLALDADGNVWGWGLNTTRQLFDGTTENRLTPVQVQGVNLN
jgi:alpha-tubulin suppressor-like RCC1 family protein